MTENERHLIRSRSAARRKEEREEAKTTPVEKIAQLKQQIQTLSQQLNQIQAAKGDDFISVAWPAVTWTGPKPGVVEDTNDQTLVTTGAVNGVPASWVAKVASQPVAI